MPHCVETFLYFILWLFTFSIPLFLHFRWPCFSYSVMKQDTYFSCQREKIKPNFKPLALAQIQPRETIVFRLKYHCFQKHSFCTPTCSASSSHLDNIAFSLHAFWSWSCRFSKSADSCLTELSYAQLPRASQHLSVYPVKEQQRPSASVLQETLILVHYCVNVYVSLSTIKYCF